MDFVRSYHRPEIVSNWAFAAKGVVFTAGSILASIGLAWCFFSDFRTKQSAEQQLHNLRVLECRRDFTENRCEDPVPGVRDLCLQAEKCLIELTASEGSAKYFTVIIHLILEFVNEISDLITNRTLIVVGCISVLTYSLYRLFPASSGGEEHSRKKKSVSLIKARE